MKANKEIAKPIIDGPRVFFGSKSKKFQTQNKGAMRSQLVNIARCLSTSSFYPKNILERLRLEYHTLDREGFPHPAKDTGSSQDVKNTFDSETLLQGGLQT